MAILMPLIGRHRSQRWCPEFAKKRQGWQKGGKLIHRDAYRAGSTVGKKVVF